MLALESEQSPSELFLAAADVVTEVQERHRWVLSDQIIATYQARIYHADYKGQVWRRIFGSFYNALVDPDRQFRLLYPPEVAGAYHQKDRPWIAAAAAAPADCCLITIDG